MVVEIVTTVIAAAAVTGSILFGVRKWIRDEMRELRAVREDDRKKMDALMAEISSLRASVEGLERQQAMASEALGKRIDDLGGRIGDLARRLDSMDARLDSMDARLDSMGTRLAAVEQEVAGLKAEFAMLKEIVMPSAAPVVGAPAEAHAEAVAPTVGTPGPIPPRQRAQAAGGALPPRPAGQGAPRP